MLHKTLVFFSFFLFVIEVYVKEKGRLWGAMGDHDEYK